MHRTESKRNAETVNEVEAAYAEYGTGLGRFVIRLCGNREDSEDILVETFVEAHRQWDAFKGSGSRKNWLYGIAVNRLRMTLRKRRFKFEKLEEETLWQGHDPVEAIALRQEIAKLPLGQREAFLLVKGEGLTAREAAEILRRPIGTVLYEVHRAMRALRNGLTDGENEIPALHRCEVEL